MHTEWQGVAPRVSPNEADQVVELWLRQRLNGSEQIPVDTSALTLPELAQALGTREEDVALLLCQIRGKSKPRQKMRPAISLKRSWKMIAAIYGAAAIAVLAYVGWQSSHRYYDPGFSYAPSYEVYQYGRQVRGSAYVSGMPKGFGFDYLGHSAPGVYQRSGATLDWAKGEKALLEQISKINSERSTDYDPLVSSTDIATAIATSPNVDGEYSGPQSYDQGRVSHLLEWNQLTINVDGQPMRTMLPSARVANESVEKAVRDEIKRRVSGMLKALQARQAPLDPSEATEKL